MSGLGLGVMYRRWLGIAGVFAVLTMVATALAGQVVYAGGVAEGYYTDDSELKPGMVVSLSLNSNANRPLVERATYEATDKVIGVAVNADDSVATFASGDHQVYIIASGEAMVYVSDINGEVKKGDNLTLSPLKGMLMKADHNTERFGTANQDFSAEDAETQTIQTDIGEKQAKVAKMSIIITTSLVGSAKRTPVNTWIKQLGRDLAGRDIGELRIATALIIVAITIVCEGAILYASISSGLKAIGRNPLAKSVISSELARVFALAVFVLLVGLGASYSVLKF